MDVEAVLLTGGGSRRMGADKASILIEGQALGERMVAKLSEQALQVTVLGRAPIAGASFVADVDEFAGPLVALSRFRATCEFVFVASCDLPGFDSRLISCLKSALGAADGAVPYVDGWRQPLCAIYRANGLAAIAPLLAEGRVRVMNWLDRLNIVDVGTDQIASWGMNPASVLGVNTPSELAEALGRERNRSDGKC